MESSLTLTDRRHSRGGTLLLIGYVLEVWLLPMTDRLPGRSWLEIDKLDWEETGGGRGRLGLNP